MTVLNFVLLVLATSRLVHDVTEEDGPFRLYLRGRGWLFHRYGDHSWQYEGVSCPVCVSLWIGLLLGLLSLTRVGRGLVAGLAGSSLVSWWARTSLRTKNLSGEGE